MFGSLLRKTFVDDTEFFVNLGDWPLSMQTVHPPLPILSWCGSPDTNDIVLPTYELSESILHSQGRISTDILSTFGTQSVPFLSKENKLFWRGRDSHEARLKLIEKSFQYKQLFNVSITNFFFFRDKMHLYTNELDTKKSYVPFNEFFNYRYQINIDGTVAAYRFPFLLSSNTLVIKQRSKYYEFFYRFLKDNIHYIDVDEQLDGLIDLLQKLIDSDTNTIMETKHIIWNARKFILSHLMSDNIYCYYYNVLTSYTKLLTNRLIVLKSDMKLVQYDQSDCNCDHHHVKTEL